MDSDGMGTDGGMAPQMEAEGGMGLDEMGLDEGMAVQMEADG